MNKIKQVSKKFLYFVNWLQKLGMIEIIKIIYSEKAKKFCEIFTLLLPYLVPVKIKVKILQNFVAFSEYMNFKVLTLKIQISKIWNTWHCQFSKYSKLFDAHSFYSKNRANFVSVSLKFHNPPYARFLTRPVRKELNVLWLKSSF